MLRPLLLTATLAGVLLAFNVAPRALALQTPASSNIGFVLYTRSPAPGTLNARWMYGNKYSGPGIATGGAREGFAGRYHVRYFYDNGESRTNTTW